MKQELWSGMHSIYEDEAAKIGFAIATEERAGSRNSCHLNPVHALHFSSRICASSTAC